MKGGDNMIENGICHITYPNGKMSLVMDQFFPTSAHNIRLLFLKTIALNWEDRQQTADDILHWLKEAHRELDAESVMKFRANKCVDQRTKAKEMQSDIDRQALKIKNLQDFIKSLPRGQKKPYQEKLKGEKEVLKGLKEKQSGLKHDAQYQNGEFIKVQALDRKFKANIELVEQLSAGWRDEW